MLALVIAGPLLGPGYLLLRDAVSTPRSYLTDSALGLGDAAPRAVPQDATLAVLSPVLDGGLIVKAILLLALWAAGYGAAALARKLLHVPLGPQLVATTVALWNPYVAERLLQGHWSLLTGYAALPWTILAAQRIRQATTRDTPPTRPGADDSAAHPSETPTDDEPPQHSPAGAGSPGGQADSARTSSRRPSWRRRPRTAESSADSNHAQPAHRPRRRIDAPDPAPARVTWRRLDAHPNVVRAWVALGGCFAAAGLTPTGALLAGCVGLLMIGRRNLLGALALLAAASAPWLMATALSGAGAEPSDPAGIAAFAARAEPGLGTLGSLAGLGGIWNADAVPGSRTTPLALIGTLVLLAIVATGLRGVATGDPRAGLRVRRILLALAAAAILLPALGATEWGRELLEWLVIRVPGAGLLRDTQKYVALAMPAYALCAAAGCRALSTYLTRSRPNSFHDAPDSPNNVPGDHSPASEPVTASAPMPSTASTGSQLDRPGGTAGRALIATLFIVLLAAPLFDLAWGAGGEMRAVRYPEGWRRVAERIDGPGDIAVLPGGMFRKFSYSGGAPVLDPAPRMLPRDVLQTGELPVHGRTVSGEGVRAREVENLLLHGGSAADLGRLGVGWVLVERTPGPLGASKATLAQLDPVCSDTQLALYRVPDVAARPPAPASHRYLAYAAHILWAAMLLAGLATIRPYRRA
ncbi:hypothetical protein [Nocardia sp. NPDC052566]|uniref:hypothetical protein n=1 Tax=Nocardia sp. NPDC052566 TaxID=3364330 RepID=UPI0037CA9824